MSDRGVAAGFSALLHLVVLGLMVFTWSSAPELRRPPEIPPHVMATVMEETRRAPDANTTPAREERDQQATPKKAPEPKPEAKPKPKPKPEPKPEPKPKPKPEPKPKPKPEPKPEPKPQPKPEPKPEPKKAEPKKAEPEKTEPAPKFEQPSMEELMAEEELEMARKKRDQVAENPGSGPADSDVTEETASYEDAIRNAISQRWRIPGNYRNRNDLSVQVRIQVIPGGEVVNVQVAKSSGYPTFDDSLVNAVKLASPLPVPDGKQFEQFRTFVIVFSPRDVQ